MSLPDIVIYAIQITTARGQHLRKGVIPSLPLNRVSYKGAFIPGSKRASDDANGSINAAAEFGDVSSELQSTASLSSRPDPSECGVITISSFLDLGDINSKSFASGSIRLNQINTRKDSIVTGAIFPAKASQIILAISGVSDLSLSVLMELVYRDPDPSCNGILSSGTLRCEKVMLAMRMAGGHSKSIAVSGSSGLLMIGSSLDPLDGDNEDLLLGFHNTFKAPTTVISSKGVLAVTTIGKATIYGFDPLFQSAQLDSDDIGAHVTVKTTDGHVLCHSVQIRNCPKGGCTESGGSKGVRKGKFEMPKKSTGRSVYDWTTGMSGLISHGSVKDVFAPTRMICRRSARMDEDLPTLAGIRGCQDFEDRQATDDANIAAADSNVLAFGFNLFVIGCWRLLKRQ